MEFNWSGMILTAVMITAVVGSFFAGFRRDI
jgi:hypothetical protein